MITLASIFLMPATFFPKQKVTGSKSFLEIYLCFCYNLLAQTTIKQKPIFTAIRICAHVAQLVEQRFRKAQVGGSIPLVGFFKKHT